MITNALHAFAASLLVLEGPIVELDTVIDQGCDLDSGVIRNSLVRRLPDVRIVSRFGDGLLNHNAEYYSVVIKAKTVGDVCAVAILVAEASRDTPDLIASYQHPYVEVFSVEFGDTSALTAVAASITENAIALTQTP